MEPFKTHQYFKTCKKVLKYHFACFRGPPVRQPQAPGSWAMVECRFCSSSFHCHVTSQCSQSKKVYHDVMITVQPFIISFFPKKISPKKVKPQNLSTSSSSAISQQSPKFVSLFIFFNLSKSPKFYQESFSLHLNFF